MKNLILICAVGVFSLAVPVRAEWTLAGHNMDTLVYRNLDEAAGIKTVIIRKGNGAYFFRQVDHLLDFEQIQRELTATEFGITGVIADNMYIYVANAMLPPNFPDFRNLFNPGPVTYERNGNHVRISAGRNAVVFADSRGVINLQ